MDTTLPSVLVGEITTGPASTHPNTPKPTQIDGASISQWIAVHRKACPECRRKHISCEHINATARKRIGPGTACDKCKRGKRRCVGVPCAGVPCSRCRAIGASCTYENKTRKSDCWVSAHPNSAHREPSQNTLTQANATTKMLPRGPLVATTKGALDRTENYIITFPVKDDTFYESHTSSSSHMEVDQGTVFFTHNMTPDRVERWQSLTTIRCFYGVPAENHAFVDRLSVQANMETALAKSPHSGGCKVLALSGLGGMGKTQLMLRYCYLYRTKYDFVFWLEVNSWSVAIDSFRKLAINLGYMEGLAKEKGSEEHIIDWFRSLLEARTNWLLLLDNADDEMDKRVFKFLPRIGGDIIITTRMHIPSSKATVIHVSKMQEKEAISLLCGSSVYSINQESMLYYYAQQIVIELDYMPLAIDHARAYIDNALISSQEYLSMLKDSKKRTYLFRYNDEDESNYYKYNIATVWQLSFNRVRAINHLAVQILEACTFLLPENIPVHLFKNQHSILDFISTSSALSATEPHSEQPWKAIQAISVLVKFSFVVRTCYNGDDDPASDSLTIHRLVLKVIYDGMDKDKRLQWAHKIAGALNNEIKFNDSYAIRTRRIMESYLPHIRHFITLLDDLSEKPLMSKNLSSLLDRQLGYHLDNGIYFGMVDLGQLSIRVSEAVYGSEHLETTRPLHNLGRLYYYQGKYSDAEPLYMRVLKIRENILGSEHPDTGASLNNLAKLYESLGKYNEAEPLYQQALVIYEKALGSEHPDTAQSLNNLALLYFNQGKYDEAEPLYKRALIILENALGSEHPYTATSLNNLALLYYNRGKCDEAELLYKQALVIRENVLGSMHPDTARSLNNIAELYRNQGKYDEAEPLYKRALAICEKTLGSEHPDTATSLNNLAGHYKSQSKYDDAMLLYKRALAIREKVLGPEHPATASSLNDLAEVYESQNKYNEVEALYLRALAVREKTLGSEHPNTATSLNNLARLYVRQHNYDKAEQLYKRALVVLEKVLGIDHVDFVTPLNNLAGLYERLGKYEEADLFYQRALAIREKSLGSEHPDTAHSLNNLAIFYLDWGKYDEAEPLYKRTLAIREKALGYEHPDIAQSLNNLALLYFSQGQYDEAEPLYRRALAIRENALGPEHPDTASSLNNLAVLYNDQGKYDEAEPLYQRALVIYEKVLGSEHPETEQSRTNLAVLYKTWGKYDEAEPLYRHALHPNTVRTVRTRNLAKLF